MGPVKPFALAAAGWLLATSAQAALIDFDSYGAGTIIDNEYLASDGVTINGVNVDRGNIPGLAVVFDTDNPTGGDNDLGAPFSNAGLGNLAPGNVLIIHEHPQECDGLTCDDPDDEGSRPAGYFDIDFGSLVTLNSIDFFDVETRENGSTDNNAILLFDEMDNEINPGTFYSPDTGGDNTWERLLFGVAGVQSLRLNLGGSGAIDNIDFTRPPRQELPVPATPLMILVGLMLLRGARNRRR